MSLQEQTYRLGDEFDRLDGDLDEAAEQLREAEPDTPSAEILRSHANDLETQLGGVAWLIDEYGEDTEVTVVGLDAGMYARVQDRASAMRAQRDEPGDIPGARAQVFAAMGLESAPFLDEGATSLDEKLSALTDGIPIGVAQWLEGRANELTTVSQGNFRSLSERLTDSGTD